MLGGDILPEADLTMFLVKKDRTKLNIGLRAQFQILILALHLALNINSTPDFNLLQVLVQDLVLQSLLKVMAPLEDVRKCCV